MSIPWTRLFQVQKGNHHRQRLPEIIIGLGVAASHADGETQGRREGGQADEERERDLHSDQKSARHSPHVRRRLGLVFPLREHYACRCRISLSTEEPYQTMPEKAANPCARGPETPRQEGREGGGQTPRLYLRKEGATKDEVWRARLLPLRDL